MANRTIVSPVRLNLHNTIQNGANFLRDVTPYLQNTWRRSIRDIGGYWLGTAKWEGEPGDMLDMFQNGLGMEIREVAGGVTTWQGYLAEMELTRKGQTYRRDVTQVVNRAKTYYSRVSSNLITNGSFETGLWDETGGLDVHVQSTDWRTDGQYSAYIENDSSHGIRSNLMTLEAGVAYDCRMSAKIVTGKWKAQLLADGGGALDTQEISGEGEQTFEMAIPPTNQWTFVRLLLYPTTSGNNKIYVDNAVLMVAPVQVETTWYDDTASQAEYGIIEGIVDQRDATDEAANALAQKLVYEKAWAAPIAPQRLEQREKSPADSLEMTFYGYAATLRNRVSTTTATDGPCGLLVYQLMQSAQYIGNGHIQSNPMTHHIDSRAGYRVWDLLRDITLAGDSSGNRWVCGVYDGRRLYYEQADTTPIASIRDGYILSPGGGALEGWLALPGMVALDDMPHAYDYNSGRQSSNRAWMNEVEFDLGVYLDGNPGVVYLSTEEAT